MNTHTHPHTRMHSPHRATHLPYGTHLRGKPACRIRRFLDRTFIACWDMDMRETDKAIRAGTLQYTLGNTLFIQDVCTLFLERRVEVHRTHVVGVVVFIVGQFYNSVGPLVSNKRGYTLPMHSKYIRIWYFVWNNQRAEQLYFNR